MLTESLNSTSPPRNEHTAGSVLAVNHDIWDGVVQSVRAEYLSDNQEFPWIIGFSGGKDSTIVAQAVFEALLQVPPSQRKRHIHLVSNDTQVESPLVMTHLAKVQTAIVDMANSLRLPVTVVTTRPAPD